MRLKTKTCFTLLSQNYQLHRTKNLHMYSYNNEEWLERIYSPPTSVACSIKEMQSTGFKLVHINFYIAQMWAQKKKKKKKNMDHGLLVCKSDVKLVHQCNIYAVGPWW